MLHIIRKNHQILMLIIVIVTIIGFAAMYTHGNPSQFGSNDVAEVYGSVVQRADIDRQARSYQLAMALGLTDYMRALGALEGSEENSLSNYLLNLLVIQHQALELGIRPSDNAVLEAIKALPPFQTDGVFDSVKYATFVQEQLSPRGFTERQLEDLIRDSLRVEALHRVIASPVAIGEEEVRRAARLYQPITAEVLYFDREKFVKEASVTPEEVAALYAKNKAGLKTGETRSLSYVALELPAAEQKLTGKEHTAALQKLADEAVAAGKAVREGIARGLNFSQSAEKATLHPKKALSLQRDGSQNGKDSGLSPAVVEGVFRMKKSGEISDVVQEGNTFFLFTVETISPSRQLELAEVTEKITAFLKSEKAAKASLEAATKSLQQIRAALSTGKSFADAVKPTGVKTEAINNLSPSEPKTEEQQTLAGATLPLKERELSQLQPAPWGAFAVYLEKRAALTEAQWKDHQATLSQKLLSNDQELIFREWLQSSRAAAQIKILRGKKGS
jgi:hypothetical protein